MSNNPEKPNDETQISDATHLSEAAHLPQFSAGDDTTNGGNSTFPSLPKRSREPRHTATDPSDDSTVLGSISHGISEDEAISEETVLSTSMPGSGNDAPVIPTENFADAGLDAQTGGSYVASPATSVEIPDDAYTGTSSSASAATLAATSVTSPSPITPAATANLTPVTGNTTNPTASSYQSPSSMSYTSSAGSFQSQVSSNASANPDSLSAPYAAATPASSIITPPKDSILEFKRSFDALVDNIGKVVVGKPEPIKLCVTALMVGGHVLLEDNPGTGKTQLARGLANSIATSFKRIQFTPDLLPSDVVGVTFYDQKSGEFEFRQGPIFASIVLADEINRASPKTQSALLEVMEEQKTTVDGKTYPMPQPFIVIATQNPLEQLGTYKLPEAQMDRFLIKTSVGAPGHDVSIGILKDIDITDRADTVSAVLSGDDIIRLRKTAKDVRVDDRILEYIERLVEATRLSEKLRVGSSMRGALALTRCARIWAAADARDYVLPDDVQDLAVPVLAHRIILNAETAFKGETAEQVVAQIVESVPAPAMGV
ncbi:AAA family ATPase [Bifidobacterium sp. ESL0769]|uniref:AAA family ATPase n=1 Tax=Bifidobacterium sp. ESL0769 TaxID=2983229 RepID=UPI0023F9C14D|nr:AAA family ATPase [Bifidobacterium sp. ESL0769]WEV67777.1 AAA family ATPase [Bifidobacterium sp. ESL0769]